MGMDRTLDNINVLLCGDANSEAVFPTLINSIVANTTRRVHVRILARGYHRDDFENGNLKVEFINYNGGIRHRDSRYVVTNDRICYLREMEDWDKCILFGWDQIIDTDLGPHYDTPIEPGNLMTAANPINKVTIGDSWKNLGQQGKLKSLLTEEAYNSPRAPMGSTVVDLKAARQSGALDNAVDFLKKLNGEDHLSMLAAFAGKIQFFDSSWNRVTADRRRSSSAPTNIYHFSGTSKPWASSDNKGVWHEYYATWADLDGQKSASDLRCGFPIFVFANPRSGSTLLMRLLNRCTASNGRRVRMNGESPCLWELDKLVATVLDHEYGRPHSISKGYTRFEPYLTNGTRSGAITAAKEFLRVLCGAGKNEPFGFKQVNYGYKSPDVFLGLVQRLRRINGAKFVFLTREAASVSRSMKSKVDWWSDSRNQESSIITQQSNFRYAARQLTECCELTYTELSNYDTFSGAAGSMGLVISREDFDYEIGHKVG